MRAYNTFLRSLIFRARLGATLDHYAQVDLEDVKREFAKLDLLGSGNPANSSRRVRLLQELAPLLPKGREQEWTLHVEALLAIARASVDRVEPVRSHRYFRVTRKSHSTARQAPRRAIGILTTDLPAPQNGTTSSFKSDGTFPESQEVERD